MLEKLFTSTTRVKVLRVLMFNPDKWFYLRELARRIKATPTYVKKEIDNLKELGLICEKRSGNLVFFCINQNSPIINELRELFIKSDYIMFRSIYARTDPDIDFKDNFDSLADFANELFESAINKKDLSNRIHKSKEGVLNEKQG